jgi:DNA-binding response OmpR family regulator
MTTAIATIPNLPQIEGANLLNLMIVDDERAIREVCREVAQTLGFHTSIADSAEHAYRVLESNLIDVVLLDLKLPGEECLATGDLHCAETDDQRPMTEH